MGDREYASEKDGIRRDAPQMRSDGVYHDRTWDGRDAPRSTEGYEPHWDEEKQGDKPLEMYHSQNAFTHLSVSASEKGRLMVSGGEKKRPGSPTLSSDSGTFRGKRRRRTVHPFGEMFTNSHNPGTGAFAFRTERNQTPRKILRQISDYRRKNGQETVDRAMPFMSLHEDREELHRLEDQKDNAGRSDSVMRAYYSRRKADAETKVRMKEEMRRKFVKKLILAQIASRHLTEESQNNAASAEKEQLADGGAADGNEENSENDNEFEKSGDNLPGDDEEK